MHSVPALLEGNVALAGRSQTTFCAAPHTAASLKILGDKETDHPRQQTRRIAATNHNISDVDWLHSLNEDITWIQGDPIQAISQQLNQNRKAGKTINELHIVAHGSNGEVKLGNTFLTKQYLEESSLLLQEWKLEAIYLWSCKAGLNVDLITVLQECTGADIYSSKTNISRQHSHISNEEGKIASLEELIGIKKLHHWEGTLFAAPFLGKEASSYQEISIDKDNVLSPPNGVTITAQTLIDDGAGNISLSSASSSHISTHEWPHGFGVTGSIGSGDTTEIGYHNASGLSEKLIIEFDEIVPEIGFATAWLAISENDGVYKMYREGTLVKTGAVDGFTDRVDPPVDLSSDDGYGFDKIEFTANGWESDYLIHKITFDAPKADNAGTASVVELDDASNQDIAIQTGNLSVSDADNAGTITASIVGDPIITLNGSSYTLPASANALTADGAMCLSPTSQAWGGSWTPITWSYDPTSADLDFIPAGQDLVAGYDIRLNDGANNSNTVRVEITITGENDAPSISNATYTLDEDTAAGTIFHDTDEDSTGNDTDIESETITYSITAGNPNGIFAIDTTTGEISIATGQSLDYETSDQHILTVEASDSAESDTANITVNINNVRPTIALASDIASLKAGETAALTFTLSEESTNFIESDITVNGGTLSNFFGSGTSYSATFTPTTNRTANGVIHVANDKFSDGAGDNNQDESDANNTVTLTVDTGRPTIALASDVASLKAGETAALTFTLSEASTNFIESDITVNGGTLSNFFGSGTSYSATFTPTTNSTANGVIHVANDKFSDAAANNNQDESDANNTVTLTVDTGRPTIAISSDVASLKAGETAALTFTLSETSTNFVESDITVNGGTLSNFSGSGTSYSATFTPATDSTTNGVIHVANDKFSDAASNNNQDESEANNTVTLTVGTIRPTIAISSDVASLKAGETAAISFTLSETSTNFVESDITVNGGTLSNFSGSGTSYSATFTPATDSTTNGVIHVANDKFSDAASNNNQDESDANNTVTLTVDTGRPTIAISSDVASLKAGETAALTFTLSETSTNFVESDITVNGGTLSNFSGSGTSYSATFTPATDSTTNGVIHVANDKFSDAASNNNQDESEANNTVTLTVDTNSITIEKTENSQTEKINTPKDLNQSFDLGQTSTTTSMPSEIDEESNQLLTTSSTDMLTNYYEFQPKTLFAQYDSLLGDSGGGGSQIPKPSSDGGTAQERGVRIIANSFCSTLDDSIIQHDASTNDTFFVVLTGAPTSGVTVSLKAPDSLQGMLSSDELYFTSENWNIPQKVTFSPEFLGVPTKDERFKLIAIASQEGGYTGTEHDSAIFNNSEKSIKQASTGIKRAESPKEDPVNLDIERITIHEELSPIFTILRIISFPAIAFISFTLNSIERFQSDISSSSQSTDQNNNHQTPAFQIGPIEANHLNGIGSESDFRLADSSQHSLGASSLLLAQTIQPTDSYF